MTNGQIRHVALVVHVLVVDERDRAQTLDELWTALVEAEHLTTAEVSGGGILRFAERQDDEVLVQALVRRSQEVRILSLVIGPTPAHSRPWSDLDGRWEAAVEKCPAAIGRGRGALGVVRIYQGALPGAPEAGVLELTDEIREAVPESRVEPSWHDRGYRADDGVVLWEVGDLADDRHERRILALLPDTPGVGTRARLSRWTWSSGDASLTPFTRYLVHAAKVRYQLRIFKTRASSIRSARDQVDREAREVLRRIVDGAAQDPEQVDGLLTTCHRLEIGVADLVQVLATMRTLRHTTEISIANRGAAVAPPAAPGTDLFSDDHALGTWFLAQLDDEITYTNNVLRGARDVIATVRTVVERQADELAAARDERRESLAQMQAALIGALALLLTAIQSLQYRVPLDTRVHPALIALCGAVALTLGLVLVRKHDLDSSVTPARHALLTTAVVAGVTCCGAASGWFLETLIRVEILGLDSSRVLSWAAAAGGAILAAAPVVQRLTGRRHAPRLRSRGSGLTSSPRDE